MDGGKGETSCIMTGWAGQYLKLGQGKGDCRQNRVLEGVLLVCANFILVHNEELLRASVVPVEAQDHQAIAQQNLPRAAVSAPAAECLVLHDDHGICPVLVNSVPLAHSKFRQVHLIRQPCINDTDADQVAPELVDHAAEGVKVHILLGREQLLAGDRFAIGIDAYWYHGQERALHLLHVGRPARLQVRAWRPKILHLRPRTCAAQHKSALPRLCRSARDPAAETTNAACCVATLATPPQRDLWGKGSGLFPGKAGGFVPHKEQLSLAAWRFCEASIRLQGPCCIAVMKSPPPLPPPEV